MHPMLQILNGWYKEAVALHGDNWHQIEQYVKNKMASLSEADRAAMKKSAEGAWTSETHGIKISH
jgi:hypothetical protein